MDVSGARIKRLTLALGVRLRTPYTVQTVLEAVRSALAAEVNRTVVSAPLSLSRLISVAERIPGVLSVLPLDPNFNGGQDLISVAPGEKLAVLDLADVYLTTIGE